MAPIGNDNGRARLYKQNYEEKEENVIMFRYGTGILSKPKTRSNNAGGPPNLVQCKCYSVTANIIITKTALFASHSTDQVPR